MTPEQKTAVEGNLVQIGIKQAGRDPYFIEFKIEDGKLNLKTYELDPICDLDEINLYTSTADPKRFFKALVKEIIAIMYEDVPEFDEWCDDDKTVHGYMYSYKDGMVCKDYHTTVKIADFI